MCIQSNNRWWGVIRDVAFVSIFLAIFTFLGQMAVNKTLLAVNNHLDERRTMIQNKMGEDCKLEVRKLEERKAKEETRRFLLEKQLAELLKINSAFSDVTRVYFAYASDKKPTNEREVKKEYEIALAKAREVINRSPFLFDLDFNKDVDRYFEVHRQMSRLPAHQWGKYVDFAMDLSNSFDDLCRSVVEGQRHAPLHRVHMPLAPISPQERVAMPPEHVVEAYFKFWKDKQLSRW